MSLPEIEIGHTYEPFSREPEYVELNTAFADTLELPARTRVADLACGTGTLTGIMLAANPGLSILGVDISREALQLAREHVAGRDASVRFVEASADCLPAASLAFDAVVMGNSIQLVDDKDALLGEIRRVLRPGGIFAFNTSFYAGTYVPGTERLYLQWIGEASKYIRQKSDALQAEGRAGVPRRKGAADRAFARPWLPAAEYRRLLEAGGLTVRAVRERTVMLTPRCFEAIGSYAGLASVLLSGYPVDLACEALARAARPVFAAAKQSAIPRYWLEMIAEKP